MQKSVNTEARDAAIVEVYRTGHAYYQALRDLSEHAATMRKDMAQGWHQSIDFLASATTPMDQNVFIDPIAAKAQFDYAVNSALASGASGEQVSQAVRETGSSTFSGVYQG